MNQGNIMTQSRAIRLYGDLISELQQNMAHWANVNAHDIDAYIYTAKGVAQGMVKLLSPEDLAHLANYYTEFKDISKPLTDAIASTDDVIRANLTRQLAEDF